MSDVFTVGSLFAGIGGIELGLERTGGFETVWQVEKDDFCQKVLSKHWPNVKRFKDVEQVGSKQLDSVDLICGGFPCQDISTAGKQEGIEGERSGLWSEFARIIREIRPRYALIENVAALRYKQGGLGVVLRDLAEIGYDAEWHCITAWSVGAPHERDRVFVIAYPEGFLGQHPMLAESPKWVSEQPRRVGRNEVRWVGRQAYQPSMVGVDNGVSDRVDRVKSLGNAVVPQVAEWIGEQILHAAPTNREEQNGY